MKVTVGWQTFTDVSEHDGGGKHLQNVGKLLPDSWGNIRENSTLGCIVRRDHKLDVFIFVDKIKTAVANDGTGLLATTFCLMVSRPEYHDVYVFHTHWISISIEFVVKRSRIAY
jgi:hypothetical protein